MKITHTAKVELEGDEIIALRKMASRYYDLPSDAADPYGTYLLAHELVEGL